MTHDRARRSVEVRAADRGDGPWIVATLTARWGSTSVAHRGRLDDASTLPALVAVVAGSRAGLATYRHADGETELVTIDALVPQRGVGSALLDAVIAAATATGSRRLWLITTNDNLAALRFYQRHGLRLVAVHPDAVAEARRRKPQIPLVGRDGIAVRDELELAIDL